MSEDLRGRILAFLRSHYVVSLATLGPAGPWAAALFYANDEDLTLYFVSDAATRHCRDLAADPRVAATVNAADPDWEAIRGLQIEGRAAPVAEAARPRVEALYLERFPEIDALLSDGRTPKAQAVARRFAASGFFAIVPSRIRLIDNTRAFGYREELSL